MRSCPIAPIAHVMTKGWRIVGFRLRELLQVGGMLVVERNHDHKRRNPDLK